MYSTSAQKKPTLPPTESSTTTTTTTTKQGGAAAAAQKQLSNTVAAASRKREETHKRLVDYLGPNALKKQPQVVMDMVTKSEVKFYDPPYLAREAPFPSYDELNINLKGYDFTVLETYHNFIARLCRSLEVDVKDVYAMPARSFKVKTYQPFSSNLDKEYSLKMYHRVVRVKKLKSTTAPLLFEAIQLNLPEGVQLSVGEPSAEEDNFRYVPDLELKELKEQLDELTADRDAPPQATAGATPASTSSQPTVKK